MLYYLREFWDWTTRDAVSFYTSVLAIFTAVLGATAIVQLKYLRRADETARISSDAAKRAADAAGMQASASVEIELPILMIVEIETLPAPRNKFVRIKVRNYGRTPAIIVADCLETKLAKTLPTKPLYSVDATFPILRDTVVETGHDYDFSREIPLTEAEWGQVQRSEAILWAYGYVDYIDFRKREHRDGFCVAFLPVRKTAAERLYDATPPSSLTWARTGPFGYTYSRYKSEEDCNAGLT